MEYIFVDNSSESEQLPALSTAYQSLLESREKDQFVSELDVILDADDKLCNTNLQTASLFKNLNEKYLDLTKQMDNLNEDEQDIYKSIQGIDKNILIIKTLSSKYYKKSIDTLDLLKTSLQKELLEIENMVKQDIIMKRIKIDTDLENVCRKQNALRKLVQTAIADMVKPEDITKKMCPICFDREVGMAMVPCGHTFCQGCSNTAIQTEYRSKCPQCRQTISTKVKIYFSV
jgi:predicted transcriptional regulator